MSILCEICGQEIPDGEEVIIDGQHLCGGCFGAMYVQCDECGVVHKLSEMTPVIEWRYVNGTREQKQVCPECLEREYVQCDDCGGWVRKDAAYVTFDGRTICEDCYGNDYFTCEDCGEVFPFEQGTTVNPGCRDEAVVCESCLDNYTQCDCCEEYFSPDRIWETDSCGRNGIYAICDNCSNDYIVCEGCNSIVPLDEVEYDEDDDAYYCHRCADSCAIHNYGYKPEAIFGTTDYDTDGRSFYNGDELTFGVELECDKGEDPFEAARDVQKLTKRLYIKHDGSLSNGYEIVTHPGTLAWHMNSFPWANVCKVSLDHGFKSHDARTCGLHIHIGTAQFGKTTRERDAVSAKIAALTDVLWPEVEQFSRRGVGGCSNWAEHDNVVSAIRAGMDEDNACRAMFSKAEREGRYLAVNVQNVNTTELRFNRGSLKPETILASLQLASNLTKFAMTHTVNECLDAKWDDIMNVDVYEELTAYVNERFAEFTPDNSTRLTPSFRVGDEIRIPESDNKSDASVAECFEWRLAERDEHIEEGSIILCNNIPEDERPYTDAVAVENHMGVHVGRFEGAAWAGSNNGQGLHRNCDHAVSRGQWNVNNGCLSIATRLRNGADIQTDSVYEALKRGFMPGDLVTIIDPDGQDGRRDLCGQTGRIVSFRDRGLTLYAIVRWNNWDMGHNEHNFGRENLVNDNSIWNINLSNLMRV